MLTCSPHSGSSSHWVCCRWASRVCPAVLSESSSFSDLPVNNKQLIWRIIVNKLWLPKYSQVLPLDPAPTSEDMCLSPWWPFWSLPRCHGHKWRSQLWSSEQQLEEESFVKSSQVFYSYWAKTLSHQKRVIDSRSSLPESCCIYELIMWLHLDHTHTHTHTSHLCKWPLPWSLWLQCPGSSQCHLHTGGHQVA